MLPIVPVLTGYLSFDPVIKPVSEFFYNRQKKLLVVINFTKQKEKKF
jgi:hypothetical protein